MNPVNTTTANELNILFHPLPDDSEEGWPSPEKVTELACGHWSIVRVPFNDTRPVAYAYANLENEFEHVCLTCFRVYQMLVTEVSSSYNTRGVVGIRLVYRKVGRLPLEPLSAEPMTVCVCGHATRSHNPNQFTLLPERQPQEAVWKPRGCMNHESSVCPCLLSGEAASTGTQVAFFDEESVDRALDEVDR